MIPQSEELSLQEQLVHLKKQFHLEELLYIATCNRVIFLFYKDNTLIPSFLHQFIGTFQTEMYAHPTEAKTSNT